MREKQAEALGAGALQPRPSLLPKPHCCVKENLTRNAHSGPIGPGAAVPKATSDGYCKEVREVSIMSSGSRSQRGTLAGLGPGQCMRRLLQRTS
jgi:hypothetical protein